MAISLATSYTKDWTKTVQVEMDVIKLRKNLSSPYQGNSQEKASDAYFRSSVGWFRVILHSLLCVAALVLGFRLSGEVRLVTNSVRPFQGFSFFDSIKKLHKVRGFNDLSTGFPHVRDDPRGFTPTLPSGLPPSFGPKSSRAHVGRHEILIRSWPHPDPLQTMVAHRLIELVQNEQQRDHGLQDRKKLLIITPTYVHAFQVVHVSSLIHTLRLIPGPLTWIVVEAGGISTETAELLSSSQLSYHHIGIQERATADWEHRKRLETLLRFEGLRFIRDHRMEGIVTFLDDSNIYTLELFDVAQKVDWIGAFSVGLLFCSRLPEFSHDGHKFSDGLSRVSKESKCAEHERNHPRAADESCIHTLYNNLSAFKEDPESRPLLPLEGPVCNTEGHVVGWYSPCKDEQKQVMAGSENLEWVGFALNAEILWEDNSKPIWIKSWNEFSGVNTSLPRNPLAFLKEMSFVEPLGNCGRDVLVWCLQLEGDLEIEFPSRWIINPPLEVVIPSKRTPWAQKLLAESEALV